MWVTINRAGKTAKTWYLRYYDVGGKRQRSKLGEYPDISIAKARAAAEDAKKNAKAGVRLSEANAEKRRAAINGELAIQEAAKSTFEAVAEAWLAKKALSWVPGHLQRQKGRLNGLLFNAMGDIPVSALTMQDIDAVIHPLVEAKKIETAKRACDLIRNVLEHADLMELLDNTGIISKISRYRREIPGAPDKRHFYREMPEDKIAALLRALEESKHRWSISTSIAMRLAPYVALRPSELCGAEWSEINFETREWLIPASRMKPRREHIVPLSRQAITLLFEVRPFSQGQKYVFPSPHKRNAAITTNALIKILRSLGYASLAAGTDSFVTHGFRGLFSTTLYQKVKYPGDLIEHQLSHIDPNKVKMAYNQINARSYLDERREMMQAYADYLDKLRDSLATWNTDSSF